MDLPEDIFVSECVFDVSPSVTVAAGRPIHALVLRSNYGSRYIYVDLDTFTPSKFIDFIDGIMYDDVAYATLSRGAILAYERERPGIITLINPISGHRQDIPFCKRMLDALEALIS